MVLFNGALTALQAGIELNFHDGDITDAHAGVSLIPWRTIPIVRLGVTSCETARLESYATKYRFQSCVWA
jgi:hypothetical protein